VVPLSENCVYAGSVWPSLVDSGTPEFLYRQDVLSRPISAVADVALFRVPSPYEWSAVIQTGSSCVADGDWTILRPLDVVDADIVTCSLYRNGIHAEGRYRVCGIAQSSAGANRGIIGADIAHFVYIMQYVSGQLVVAGDSGAPAITASGQLHSFVRSIATCAPAATCHLATSVDIWRMWDQNDFASRHSDMYYLLHACAVCVGASCTHSTVLEHARSCICAPTCFIFSASC